MAAVDSISNQTTIQQIIDKTSSQTTDRNTGSLGKTDFLNLLVTQLRYQDPLNPSDDKEFIGQLAQFNSLEQMQNMNSSMTQSQAYSMIGKYVTGTVTNDTTGETSPISGTVTSVKVSSGKTYLEVKGQDVPIDSVTNVQDGTNSADTNLGVYTNLIGFRAEGDVYDSSTGDIVDVSGTVRSIAKGTYENYAVMDGVNVQISNVGTNSSSATADPNYRRNYLQSNLGKQVTVTVVDPANNQSVPVTATLKSYNIDSSGKITAVLDGVNVPVESIYDIDSKSQQAVSSYTGLIGLNVNGNISDSSNANSVAVNGTVQSVEADSDGNYALINGVDANIIGINGSDATMDPEQIKAYLTSHVGQKISVTIKDAASGDLVDVDAILSSCVVDPTTGDISQTTLDQLKVPVNNISNIKSRN